MKASLQGKVAVVTGSGSGIGAAVTGSFLRAGASVLATGRRLEKLEQLSEHEKLELIAGDVTEPNFANTLLDTAITRFGHCDIVVNNAGVMWAGAAHEIDIEHVVSMVRVNIEAAFRVAHVFVRYFYKRNSGQIINTSSVLGTKVRPNVGAYSATKYAVEALSETMRMELSETNVKVSCVEPGLVITDLHDHFDVHPKDASGLDEPLVPEDIARIVLEVATQPDHVLIPKVMVLPKHGTI
jgi:NADP-dependent 3-hydroxy acid dehydrogenase YdfG